MVVVLVRVDMGVSYDNNTLRMANSTNLGSSEPVQHTPLAFALPSWSSQFTTKDE